MKIVINTCYGGFSVSDTLLDYWRMEHPRQSVGRYDFETKRTDPQFIELVERLGVHANGNHAKLKVVDIPDEATDWIVQEYDGIETVLYVLDGKIHGL